MKEALGHRDIRTTLKYAHLSPAYLNEVKGAMDAMGVKISEAVAEGRPVWNLEKGGWRRAVWPVHELQA